MLRMGHALRDESFKSDTMYGGKERGIKRRGNARLTSVVIIVFHIYHDF